MPTSSHIVSSTVTPLNKPNNSSNFNPRLGGNSMSIINKGIE